MTRTRRDSSPRLDAVRDSLTALFLARGFIGLDLDAMAAHASCSKSTLYELAESKEQLVAGCVEHYFRTAAEHVEAAVQAEVDPAQKVRVYLAGVATELERASAEFLDDVASRAATRGSYERHTAIAATRVRQLIGAASAGTDSVRAHFLGEVAASTMDAIERGGVSSRTGLSHARAYAELADVVLAAIRP